MFRTQEVLLNPRLLMAKVRRLLKFSNLILPILCIGFAHADTILTLTDGGTSVTVDPASSAGITSFTINGSANLLLQQWFWFRTGSTFSNQSALQTLNTISAPDTSNSLPDFGIGDILYQNSSFSSELVLNAADCCPAALDSQWTFTNLTSQQVALTVFQLVHFHLSPSGDSATINGNTASQTGSAASSQVSVTSVNLTHSETADATTLLAQLNNPTTSATFNLNDQSSATGDVVVAYEWSVLLARSGNPSSDFSLTMQDNITPAPEPGSMLLIGAGVLAFYGRRFRKRRVL
jgi:hypothetical protein